MTLENPLEVRQRLAGDALRPRYHFLPPSNWMNDPNGFIQWKGKWHLFYQCNPYGPLWANMHWGHASSDDLVTWSDLPIALTPTPGGADETGCFSGCAVDADGVPTFFYTGTRGEKHEIQTQCMATSDDSLVEWTKYPGNPVLGEVPAVSGQTRNFRDPFVWKEGDTWYMAVGSQIGDVGAAFLYRSQNLTDWEYLNPLMVGEPRHGIIWECPNFFKLGDQWVLIISSHLGITTGSVIYFVGKYENFRFTPTSEGVLDYAQLYAPLSTVDDQGRRVLIGWLRETRSAREMERAGWSGVQSIPRVLGVDAAGRLTMTPIPEIEKIRGAHQHFSGAAVKAHFAELALDIEAEFTPPETGECGLSLVYQPEAKERVEFAYDRANQQLAVRHVLIDQYGLAKAQTQTMPHELAPGEALELRVFLDGSAIELIANGRTSLATRVYPLGHVEISVETLGANDSLRALDIWEMPSIWR